MNKYIKSLQQPCGDRLAIRDGYKFSYFSLSLIIVQEEENWKNVLIYPYEICGEKKLNYIVLILAACERYKLNMIKI